MIIATQDGWVPLGGLDSKSQSWVDFLLLSFDSLIGWLVVSLARWRGSCYYHVVRLLDCDLFPRDKSIYKSKKTFCGFVDF